MPGPQDLFSRKHPAFVPQQGPAPFPPNNQGGSGFNGGVTPGTIAGLSITDSEILSVSSRKIDLVGAKVYNSAAESVADGVAETLAYNTAAFDEGGFFDPLLPGRITVPYTGIYVVSAYAEFVSDAVGRRRLLLYINSVANIGDGQVPLTGAPTSVKLMGITMFRTAGDYLSMEVFQNSGGPLNVGGGEGNNFLSAIFMGNI